MRQKQKCDGSLRQGLSMTVVCSYGEANGPEENLVESQLFLLPFVILFDFESHSAYRRRKPFLDVSRIGGWTEATPKGEKFSHGHYCVKGSSPGGAPSKARTAPASRTFPSSRFVDRLCACPPCRLLPHRQNNGCVRCARCGRARTG